MGKVHSNSLARNLQCSRELCILPPKAYHTVRWVQPISQLRHWLQRFRSEYGLLGTVRKVTVTFILSSMPPTRIKPNSTLVSTK